MHSQSLQVLLSSVPAGFISGLVLVVHFFLLQTKLIITLHVKLDMNEYDLLVKTLQQFGSPVWINQYFNLLKQVLIDLELDDSDARLALSLRKDKTLPVNIGQRYILRPLTGEKIGCIVPADFAHEAVNAYLVGYFSPKTTRDAKWIIYRFPTGTRLPAILFNAIIEASTDILNKTKKSGFRKYHNSLLYYFTMEPAVRSEVLAGLK